MSLDSLIHFAKYWDEGTVIRKACPIWWRGLRFLFVKNFFYWHSVVLQCCVHFCCAKGWVRYIHIYIYPLPLELPSHLLVMETLIASQKMHYCWASSKEIELHTPVFFPLFTEEMVYSPPINFDALFCWAMGGTPPLPNDGRETVTWG